MSARPPALRILSPTGMLGYGFPEASFRRGVRRRPHVLAVDAGSTDPGPYYLGSGKSFTNRTAVRRDLRLILEAGLRLNIPVIIGSAGGAGARPHVHWCRDILLDLAREAGWSFRLGVIYTDVPRRAVRRALRSGKLRALPGVPELTETALTASRHLVAQVGTDPVRAALRRKCQVILCGRCYDPAVFAALPLELGHDPGLSLHLGKILECAAIAATPGSAADCVLGTLQAGQFVLESMNPARCFTRASAAAHTLYEKSDPYHLPGPGGTLNLEHCEFIERAGGKVVVRGSRFEPAEEAWIKIEGARRTGYRSISIAGIRDPIMLSQIDAILEETRRLVHAMHAGEGRILFHVYGRDGVMRQLEPVRRTRAHELGLVMEALAPTQHDADVLCGLTRSTLLHYGYPGRIATAGNLAIPFSPSDFSAGPVYEFSVYHLMRARDMAGFPVHVERVGGRT